MGAGIRKPKPPNLVPENGREVESNIVEISPEDHEFYQHSSSSNDNDDAHHKKKHHHHPSSTHNEQHQKNNRTHDLHLIDFQDQEIPTKEFDDRQNSIRMPSELSKNEKKTKTHEEQHKKIDEYHVLSLDTEALNIPLYSLGETSPERKQSRQKILDSLVISSDDHRRQSKDRNDIKAETITKERSHSPVLRPSSSKTSSPPRSASTKIRLSPQKEKSTSVLHPSHHFSIPDISFQRKSPSPVESSKFEPAPPDLDSSPVNTSLTIQDDIISPRSHNNGYLTSPRDTSLEIRHKSHHNSVSNSRKNSMEASPPTPFYNKSKHEAVFHQLQINELRNSLDDDHVNSLIDEPKTSSPPIPHLLTSISSTPTEVSLVSPSLRSDLDDDEAAALMGHGKIVQKIKKENKLLLELQRQRTVSTMQNAKLELEVDSLRRQLEYLDKLEQEEEEQRLIEKEAKISSKRGWNVGSEVNEEEYGGSNSSKHTRHQPMPYQQPKPQLPPGIQIVGNAANRKLNPSTSIGGLAANPMQSLQISSPRPNPSDGLKKNNSAAALSPRSQPRSNKFSHNLGSSPSPSSPRFTKQPSEGLNVSPIRRANAPSTNFEVVGKSNLKGEPKLQSNIRQPSQSHKALQASNVEHDNDSANGSEMKMMQKQNSRSVLKNVNRRHRHSSDTPIDESTPPMIFPEKVPSSYLDVNTRQEPPTEPPLGIGAISVAAGKRKHLLSKINEKKGSDGGESLNLDSKVSDQLELPSGDPPATVTKETGKTRISRKPKDRRLQQIKAGQKKPRNDDLEESFEENSSDRPRGAVDWSATMDMRRNEVEFLLRRPINSDADIQFAFASAEAGLIFMDELDRVAKSLNMLRGALSRWLLPYDNNTSIADQASNFSSVVDHMPDYLRGKLTEKQVNYLVSGLNGVRQLIRVKIADDNDLAQARVSLQTAADFFRRLISEAEKCGDSPYHLFRSHT